MIKTVVKMTCDHCRDMMAEHPFPCSVSEANEAAEEWGGLVEGNRHFCDSGCFAKFCRNQKKEVSA